VVIVVAGAATPLSLARKSLICCFAAIACRPRCAAPCCRDVRVSEADAAAIRAIFDQQGEASAAVELRRLFPVIAETAQAWDARAIAGRKPPPHRDSGASTSSYLVSRTASKLKN
jgi:hypothetical protein